MRIARTSRALLTAVAVVAMQAPADCQGYGRYELIPVEQVESRLRDSGATRATIDFAREQHAALVEELNAAAETRDTMREWLGGHGLRGDTSAQNDVIARAVLSWAISEQYFLGAREEEAEFLDALRDRPEVGDDLVDDLARDRRRERVLMLRHGPYEWPAYTALLDVSAWAGRELGDNARSDAAQAVLDEFELALDPLLVEMDELAVTRIGDLVRASRDGRSLHLDGRLTDAALRRLVARPVRGAALIAEVRALNESTLHELAALLPARSGQILAAQRRHEAGQIVPEHDALASRIAAALERADVPPQQKDSLRAILDRLDAERERHEAVVMRLLAPLRSRAEQEQQHMTWIRKSATATPGTSSSEPLPPSDAYLAYEGATRTWRESIKTLGREVSSILGEEQVP